MKWDCKCRGVMFPKYRRRKCDGGLRRHVVEIVRHLSRQKGVELLEGSPRGDHIRMLLSAPPKYSIGMTTGYLKDKSVMRIHRELLIP